jgi:hypothetical protein
METRKSEDGENPLMRSITEHSLGDEPKHVMEKECSTQEKEKYAQRFRDETWKLGRPGQNGKKNVCHRGVRVWAFFNRGKLWLRS